MAQLSINPAFTKDQIIYKSILNTLLVLLKDLKIISLKMQKYIVKQEWIKVYELSEEQDNLNKSFDKSIEYFNKNLKIENDMEIKILKNDLKNQIKGYKEIEFINSKLLKDALFAAKQKVKYYFKNHNEIDTYKKDMKKESNIWNNNPVMLDKFI